MAPGYKDKDDGVVFALNAKWVSWAHTVVAYAAFFSALIVGISLHYHKIVQNQWYGYPEEWFPSVSSTIGDRYPERSFFMVFIAITSGPRFMLVGLWYLLTRKNGGSLARWIAGVGVFRTLTCGGWTYVTSTDDHDWHDIFMISYLVATLPWTIGCIALTPTSSRALKYRKYAATAFFGTIAPLVYFFIQHKVHRVAGAYTIYSFFEWSLVLFDVAFDAATALDFDAFELVVRDARGATSGASSGAVAASKKNKSKAAAAAAAASGLTVMGVVDTAAYVYHGFIFWTIITSLGVVVWYFPLWHMGISGYEAFVMSTISPLLLAVPPLRTLITRNLRAVHVLSLAGVAAYLVPRPEYRLFTVGFGVFMTTLGWAGSLSADSVHEAHVETKVLAWLLGLVLSSTVKFAWWTNNPLWPIMHEANGGVNAAGLAVGLLAAWRFTRRAPAETGRASPSREGSSLLAACSLGGLLFGLHSLLSDSSTMILWVWEGYPVRGPVSSVHGWCTVAAMTAGLYLGTRSPGLAASWTSYGVGCLGAAVVTLYHNWVGYSGALALAVYLMASSVPLVKNAARKSPALTFGLGFFIYNFLVLFHVWVVAYAFVPGGPLVREHTDWVMATMMVLIGCGVFDYTTLSRRARPLKPPSSSPPLHRRYLSLAAVVVNVYFLYAAFARFPSHAVAPYHADDRLITAGIWTIHFSLDNDMWSSEYRMRDLLRELEVDVVGLLESDLQRIIMGNRDTTQFLAEDLGMYVDYGPGPDKHTWGAALLSRFPILNSTHHLLPSPQGELAPAIHATIDAYGELVDVFVFHSGQEEDPEDRRLQAEYLAALMGSSPRPSILLSYLVTKPLRGNYNTYVSDRSGMHDVDPSDWDRWCEYILYKKLRRVAYARVSRSTITDTELQVAKFVVPRGEKDRLELEGWDDERRNRGVGEGDVVEGWRFPAFFRGEGVRGHRYHVFDAPRYYN